MRDRFARALTEAAIKRNDVCLLSGDIGNRMFDQFKEVAPDRFFNCGIAEANMMSIASGMALSGLKPVVYTITPFTTTRCLEQIKIGVAYHEAPVVIVGTGSGLSYAELGATHHSLEDIAILRSLPGLNIVCPADADELSGALDVALNLDSPTYIRLGKKGETRVNGAGSTFGIGKANILKGGSDMLLIGIGPILNEVLTASNILEEVSISTGVVNLGSVKPLDKKLLESMAKKYKKWISIEEHSIIGGAGSALIQWLSEEGHYDVKVKLLGTPDSFIHELGDQRYTRKLLGLTGEEIAKSVQSFEEEEG